MRSRIVILLCVIFIVSVYSKNARIIGGQLTDIYDFPYIVSIRLYSTNGFICAGSIISNKCILTAGHCVDEWKNDFSDVRVYTGSTTLSGVHRSSFFVEKIYVHPGFGGQVIGTGNNHRDIAVVTVRGMIRFNEVQKQIDLPTENIIDDSDVVIYGWGTTSSRGDYSDHLRKITVKVVKLSECKRTFFFPVLKDQICTYKSGKGTGPGDSGGPVTSNGKVVGVVSYSVWMDNEPDIQSNVFKNLDFINSVVNINNNQ